MQSDGQHFSENSFDAALSAKDWSASRCGQEQGNSSPPIAERGRGAQAFLSVKQKRREGLRRPRGWPLFIIHFIEGCEIENDQAKGVPSGRPAMSSFSKVFFAFEETRW